MKRSILILLLTTVVALFSATINAQVNATATTINVQHTMKPTDEAVNNLKAYPATIDSLERHVIYLEERTNENLFKVEIIAGKMLEVDCNNHTLMGTFNEEVVQGWGFNYYKFQTNGQIASTMMMCHEPKTMKFVHGQPQLVGYNSRLPIVVYLSKGIELKYRIWSAGEQISVAK